MQRHFMVHAPGWIYAGDFYGRNKREAMGAFRKWAGIDRAPRGTTIWELRP